MWSEEERLKRLTDLSERASDLRLLAAKMEPVGEELQESAQFSKYDWNVVRSGETSFGESGDEQARERTAELADSGSGMLAAVEELREIADRVEGLVGNARKLFRRQPAAESAPAEPSR